MKYTVDRIENGIAVLENDKSDFISVPTSELPDGIRDGSVLIYDNGKYFLDADAEKKRRQEMFEKQQRLLKRKK